MLWVVTLVWLTGMFAQAVTGKEILFGFDVQGRPALYTPPNRQSTTDPVRQVQFVVWMLERCIDQMQAGVEYVSFISIAFITTHPPFLPPGALYGSLTSLNPPGSPQL